MRVVTCLKDNYRKSRSKYTGSVDFDFNNAVWSKLRANCFITFASFAKKLKDIDPNNQHKHMLQQWSNNSTSLLFHYFFLVYMEIV